MGYRLRTQRLEIKGQVRLDEGRQPLVQPGIDFLVLPCQLKYPASKIKAGVAWLLIPLTAK
jgi:hypothetical protein